MKISSTNLIKIPLWLVTFFILSFFKNSAYADVGLVITYKPGECVYERCDTRCVTDTSAGGCWRQRKTTFCCYTSVYYNGVFHHSTKDCASCSGWGTFGTCDCSACNNCCTPVPCKDCTPAIPDGYTDVNNGCKVTTTRSCTGNNGCGSSCTVTRTRWLIETNEAETQPASLSITVDDETFLLSTESTTPTKIKYPSKETTADDVKISIPSRVIPPTSDGLGYHFRVNNYGLNNEWIAYTDCINPRPEDFCSESTNNIQDFTPSSYTVLNTLKQGAEGKVSGMYYTVNRCDDGKLYSLPIETYYKVDNIPEPVDVCEWNSALLASDPECINPPDGKCQWDPSILATDPKCIDPGECSMEEDLECTKKEFFTNIGDEDSTSSKGCYSEDYTGIEINNPLKIRVGGVDKDGVDEIKGAVVWFSKSNNTPTLPLITETYSSTSTDDLGILILQDGADWNNPKIYGINSNNTWGRITDGELINSDGQQIASISDVTVTKGEEVVTFEIILELLTNNTDMLSGTYNFKSIVLDSYMLLSDGRVDISHMIRHFNWGVDLERPAMIDLDQKVLDSRELYLNWNVDGTNSGIMGIVINGYRDQPLVNDTISLFGFPNQIILDSIPPEDEIGHLTDTNTWIFNYTNPYSLQVISTDTNRINITENEGGIISMYVTAYDQGCNDNLRAHNIDLKPWIATKGGIVYSKASLGASAKNVSEVDELIGVFKNILREEIDTGTELISSRQDYIANLINPTLGAVRAINTYDSNDRKMYWFDYLNKKLKEQKSKLGFTETEIPNTSSSTTCILQDNCLIYSSENITIPSGFVCDKNTLVMSEKDIILNPEIIEIENNQSTSGCIFLAKRNILIKEGLRKSTTSVGYDYIEGFLIAENQILVESGDINESIRDGLEIKGGLVAMGSENSFSAILLERNLRLFNYSHPTLVVAWDIKYARLSEVFFGTEAPMYKQEVGFKLF